MKNVKVENICVNIGGIYYIAHADAKLGDHLFNPLGEPYLIDTDEKLSAVKNEMTEERTGKKHSFAGKMQETTHRLEQYIDDAVSTGVMTREVGDRQLNNRYSFEQLCMVQHVI